MFMQVLIMSDPINTRKIAIIGEMADFCQNEPYDAERFSKYVYIRSLDERLYLFGDAELNRLVDAFVGMSAGEEFHCSKEEVLEMLQDYASSLK